MRTCSFPWNPLFKGTFVLQGLYCMLWIGDEDYENGQRVRSAAAITPPLTFALQLQLGGKSHPVWLERR